jgi:hypothetical protein
MAEAPWWSNLISILLTAAVSVLGTLYATGNLSGRVPGAQVPSVTGLFRDTITYIPHILLLFGILADVFTYEGVYSIPTLIGLLSIPLNWVMKYFWTGIEDTAAKITEIVRYRAVGPAAPAPPAPAPPVQAAGAIGEYFRDYDGCNIQGFGWAASKYAPQTLVVTATIFSYYMFDLIANRGWTNATATILVFMIVFVGQTMVVGGCPVNGDPGPGTGLKGLAALLEGMFFGGTSYAIVQTYYPTKLPSGAISPFPRKSPKDLTMGADGTYVDENGLPYICLPNGQCVPDMSSTDSRSEFARIAAANMGTSAPAVPASCST